MSEEVFLNCGSQAPRAPPSQSWQGGYGAIPGGAGEWFDLQAHGPCLCSGEWSATWPCQLLAPALPAKEGQNVGRDNPPLAQAAPGKEETGGRGSWQWALTPAERGRDLRIACPPVWGRWRKAPTDGPFSWQTGFLATDRQIFGLTDFYTNGFLDGRLKKKIVNGLSKTSSYGLFWASF